jgi:hypothetical protein
VSAFLLTGDDPVMPGIARGMEIIPGDLYVTDAERGELAAGTAGVWVLPGRRFQFRGGYLHCTRGCGAVCQPRDGHTLDLVLAAARDHQCPAATP